jgi:predicted transcriptional regulator
LSGVAVLRDLLKKLLIELRTLADYLNLNYPIVLHADPDGGYVAEIFDLSC